MHDTYTQQWIHNISILLYLLHHFAVASCRLRSYAHVFVVGCVVSCVFFLLVSCCYSLVLLCFGLFFFLFPCYFHSTSGHNFWSFCFAFKLFFSRLVCVCHSFPCSAYFLQLPMRLKESWLYQGNDKWLSLISVQDMERALVGRRLQNKHNNYTVNWFFCSGNSTSMDNGKSKKRVCFFFFCSNFHMSGKLIQIKENVKILLLSQSRQFLFKQAFHQILPHTQTVS